MAYAPEKKRRRLRFSLRSLVVLVLLIPGGVGLCRRWDPWVLERTFERGDLSHDGSYLIASGAIVNAQTGTPIRSLAKGRARFTPDGEEIVIVSDKELTIEKSYGGEALGPFRLDFRTSFEIGPRGRRVITWYRNGTARIPLDQPLRLYDVCTGEELAQCEGQGFCFSPNGKSMATWGKFIPRGQARFAGNRDLTKDNRIYMWDTSTGILVFEVTTADPEPVSYARFSACGSRLISFSGQSNIRSVDIWDANAGRHLGPTHGLCGNTAFVSSDLADLIISNTGDGMNDKTVYCSGIDSYLSWEIEGGLESLSQSPDGSRYALLMESGIVVIVDAATGTKLTRFQALDRAWGEVRFMGVDDRIWTQGDKQRIWRRRRPEQWWGTFWLWETWVVMVFGVALVHSLYRDRRRFWEQKGVASE